MFWWQNQVFWNFREQKGETKILETNNTSDDFQRIYRKTQNLKKEAHSDGTLLCSNDQKGETKILETNHASDDLQRTNRKNQNLEKEAQ